MEKKARVEGSCTLSITIPDNGAGAPDLDSLPELIRIPRGCTADIMFKLDDDGVVEGWKFERFVVRPLAPRSRADDFTIDEHPRIPDGSDGKGQEFALDERMFNVHDENKVAGIFWYELVAGNGTAQVRVDPGIGNGGQN